MSRQLQTIVFRLLRSRGRTRIVGLAIVALLVGYVLLRPFLERSLNVRLPQISEPTPSASGTPAEFPSGNVPPTPRDPQTATAEQAPHTESPRSQPATDRSRSAKALRPLGELADVGQGVLQSTAGLCYGKGSREGHRLKHVMLHAQDQPNRPGKHGVFDGDQDEVVATIDEAYLMSKRGGSSAKRKVDGPRTIWTIDMGRRIGFVGGQVGGRQNHPPATSLRLVLEGDRVITAFPVLP